MTAALHIDCMEYMRILEDNAFDIGNCDVPYGIGENTKANNSRGGFVKQKNGSKIYVPATDFEDENWDESPPSQKYFDELFRVCKHVILWGANYYDFNQKESSSGRIIWDKCRRKDAGQSDGEVAWTNLFSSVRIITYLWDGFQQGKSLKNSRISKGNKATNEKRLQNGHKPVKLYEGIAGRFYKHGMRIFDSHLGSGSHRIACERMGFEFVGTEISEKRFQQSVDWYEEERIMGNLKPKNAINNSKDAGSVLTLF